MNAPSFVELIHRRSSNWSKLSSRKLVDASVSAANYLIDHSAPLDEMFFTAYYDLASNVMSDVVFTRNVVHPGKLHYFWYQDAYVAEIAPELSNVSAAAATKLPAFLAKYPYAKAVTFHAPPKLRRDKLSSFLSIVAPRNRNIVEWTEKLDDGDTMLLRLYLGERNDVNELSVINSRYCATALLVKMAKTLKKQIEEMDNGHEQ